MDDVKDAERLEKIRKDLAHNAKAYKEDALNYGTGGRNWTDNSMQFLLAKLDEANRQLAIRDSRAEQFEHTLKATMAEREKVQFELLCANKRCEVLRDALSQYAKPTNWLWTTKKHSLHPDCKPSVCNDYLQDIIGKALAEWAEPKTMGEWGEDC